jgi:hypothetical protein
MVKRKSSFDKVEKAARKPKTTRRVSRKLVFEELASVVKDGTLLVKKGDEVFFMRKKESKPIVCVGTVMEVDDRPGRNDGVVTIWDETHEECYGFNWRKDMDKVDVRFFADAAPAAVEEPAAKVEKIEQLLSEGEILPIVPIEEVALHVEEPLIIDADAADEHVAPRNSEEIVE